MKESPIHTSSKLLIRRCTYIHVWWLPKIVICLPFYILYVVQRIVYHGVKLCARPRKEERAIVIVTAVCFAQSFVAGVGYWT